MDSPWCTQQISFFLSRSVEPAISNSSTKEHQSNWGDHLPPGKLTWTISRFIREIHIHSGPFSIGYVSLPKHMITPMYWIIGLSWPLTKPHLGSCPIYCQHSILLSNHERFLQCSTGLGKNCPKELFGNEYLRFQKNRRCSSAHSVAKGNLKICWQALVTLVYMGNEPSQP